MKNRVNFDDLSCPINPFSRVGFGKHHDIMWCQVPLDYLRWLNHETEDAERKAACQWFLDHPSPMQKRNAEKAGRRLDHHYRATKRPRSRK